MLRTCTWAAAASRSMATMARWVISPRTIESSTTTSRLPAMASRSGLYFGPDTALPDRLAGLDEGAADVGVLDQALAVGDAAGLRVADGRGRAGLRHRDDQVGVRRPLGRELAADLFPRGLQAAARDRGVRPGEVDVLEQAAARGRGREPVRPDPVLVDGDHLAGLDLAHEGRADDVQRHTSRWRPSSRSPAARGPAAGSPADRGPRTASARP